jgi:hypothetical protein
VWILAATRLSLSCSFLESFWKASSSSFVAANIPCVTRDLIANLLGESLDDDPCHLLRVESRLFRVLTSARMMDMVPWTDFASECLNQLLAVGHDFPGFQSGLTILCLYPNLAPIQANLPEL